MKDKASKNIVKKPIYKRWWFWALLVVILAAIFGNRDSATTQEITSDEFISEVKEVLPGAIGSENESITDVELKNGDLHIIVDLSNANPAPLTIEDLAISRTGSITDAILRLSNYDSQWETITVDFGNIGKIVCDKDSIQENEVGGRYFPSVNFILE